MTKLSRRSATIGVRSNIPIEGITRRMGARMGSVTWYSIELMGSSPLGETHDMTTLPKMARFKAYTR